MIVLIIICFCFAAAAGSIIFHTTHNGISPMPSSSRVRKVILEIIHNTNPRGIIFELGSGWGSMTFPMARRFPESNITSIENSPVPYFFSKCMAQIFSYRNLKIFRENFYHVLLSDADVIFTYLYPGGMERLKEKFEKELKKNAVVISNTFAVPGWKPYRVIDVSDIFRSKIYIYLIGKTYESKVDLIK